MTSVIMLFIQFVLRVPLRMSEEALLVGDDWVHGEDAYSFGPDVPVPHRSLLHGDTGRARISGDGELGVIQGQFHPKDLADNSKKGDT